MKKGAPLALAKKKAPQKLAKRRAQAAAATIVCFISLLFVLALARGLTDWFATPHLADYLTEPSTEAAVDPLGIASEELKYMRVSSDASVFWYSSAGGRAYSAALIDHALQATGWISCSFEEQILDSYLRYPSGARLPEYATVLYYEYETGCSIVIEVLR